MTKFSTNMLREIYAGHFQSFSFSTPRQLKPNLAKERELKNGVREAREKKAMLG